MVIIHPPAIESIWILFRIVAIADDKSIQHRRLVKSELPRVSEHIKGVIGVAASVADVAT